MNTLPEKITHDYMMALTATMPMKTIIINDEPYLERYFAMVLPDGTQIWYHRFLRNDSERHLHSHPWQALSTILVGYYVEECAEGGVTTHTKYTEGERNRIYFGTTHRIVEVEPDTWTMMIVDPGRLAEWHFIDDDSTKTAMPTSPFEWHKDCKPRAA